MSRIKSSIDFDDPANDQGVSVDYSPSHEEEQEAYLWHCLCALRGHVSAETFAKVEKELGFQPSPPPQYVFKLREGETLPF